MVRRPARSWPDFLWLALWIASLFAALWFFRTESLEKLCENTTENRSALRSVLIKARDESRPFASDLIAHDKFYRRVLAVIPPDEPC